MFAAVLDRLAGRMRQRTSSAHERIESAAKATAAGENIDVGGLEESLFTVAMGVDQFRQLCDLFSARRERFAKLDGLGAARKRLAKLDQEIESANAGHAELVEKYRQRYATLRGEANDSQAVIDEARNARDWLLAVPNCPPSIRPDYEAALATEQKALEAVGDASRQIRQLTQDIQTEIGWIEQVMGQDVRLLHPPKLTIAKSERDKLSADAQGRIDTHEKRKARLERQLGEANQTLAECQKQQAAAEATLATVRKNILAA